MRSSSPAQKATRHTCRTQQPPLMRPVPSRWPASAIKMAADATSQRARHAMWARRRWSLRDACT
eukprot:7253145-Prymnesium_polylepis.5